MTAFTVASHSDLSARIRLVAPRLAKSEWQTLQWTADAGGRQVGPVDLRVYVGGQ
jgi:hypothetical protein